MGDMIVLLQAVKLFDQFLANVLFPLRLVLVTCFVTSLCGVASVTSIAPSCRVV